MEQQIKEGDTIYHKQWKCICIVRKFTNEDKLYVAIPNYKMIATDIKNWKLLNSAK